MFEKVGMYHPDKVADRLAGAIVDLAYSRGNEPRIAVEATAGHGKVCVIIETSLTSEELTAEDIDPIIHRLYGEDVEGEVTIVAQDPHLAENQERGFTPDCSAKGEGSRVFCPRAGDNGIFRGSPVTDEQRELTALMKWLGERWPSDAKAVLTEGRLIVCQSGATRRDVLGAIGAFAAHKGYGNSIVGRLTPAEIVINPLGEWSGGPDVDTGAVNRKLGSDMGDGVTGGGLHGKDLSKADVSVNIYAHLKAQRTGKPVEIACAIGDKTIDGLPFSEIVATAREYIQEKGGFEKFAEWGLIC